MSEPTTVEAALWGSGIESEACIRCGDPGPDLRTLVMECMYDMSELNMPLEYGAFEGKYREFDKSEMSHISGTMLPTFKPATAKEDRIFKFFTLRVCKMCRSTWMTAIEEWYNNFSERELSMLSERATENRALPGEPILREGAIYVREHGATVEISREEWDRRQAERPAG